MKCPICEKHFKEIDIDNVAVDICEQCGGVWLDCNELAKLDQNNSISKLLELINTACKKQKVKNDFCPVCKMRLDMVCIEEVNEYFLLCPQCKNRFHQEEVECTTCNYLVKKKHYYNGTLDKNIDECLNCGEITDCITKKVLCPKCNVVMMNHFYSIKKETKIDECPLCGGIWLAGGKLAKIREEFVSEKSKHKYTNLISLAVAQAVVRGSDIKSIEEFQKDIGRSIKGINLPDSCVEKENSLGEKLEEDLKMNSQREYQSYLTAVQKVNRELKDMVKELEIKEDLIQSKTFKQKMGEDSKEGIKLSDQIEETGQSLKEINKNLIKKKNI